MNFQEKVYNQVSRDRLELCRGGGCISIFGIPFFLAGLFTLGIGLRIIPVSNAAELPWWAWFVVLGMGLVFTGVGSAMVFGRNWITIDKTQRRIWFAYGLLRPMRGKSYDLGDYSAIILSRNAGDSDTSDTFPVSLVNANRGSDLEVFSSVSYGVSRKQAELLLRFLGFALTDQTTGTELVQKAR
ncbi:MAG: hypothetical protein U1C33_04135, partial [Candidatus Cloacimonadaceae bacterium]|nr:hypothetical protein [Candidatus Cloacimonadaceae bacterium]